MVSNDWTAIARYVSGEATPDERAELEACATADPQFARVLNESFIGWTAAGAVPRQRDHEAAWVAIESRVAESVHGESGRSLKRHSHREGYSRGRVGRYVLAGVVGAVVSVLAVLQLSPIRVMQRFSAQGSAYTTYATTNGERATITLPDGNSVTLNVASRLEVPTNYSSGNHVIRLPVGEALFTISHHAGTPFTVIAGPVTARVLGTSFAVRRYSTDTVATVAVAEGKVAVGNAVVTEKQLVEVGRTGVFQVRPVDASFFTFASGVLTLGATQLSNAIPQLDRWYDADIRLGDRALGGKQIEGTVKAGSIADLVELLEWTCDVRVVRDGRVLTLYPKAK